ncbi:hypothetical protein B0H13DRAFT_1867282 [Mycena leptocephala]|nr:hypothetical protein B0H13DRAFT_1867282 [Mycena leptocephala]
MLTSPTRLLVLFATALLASKVGAAMLEERACHACIAQGNKCVKENGHVCGPRVNNQGGSAVFKCVELKEGDYTLIQVNDCGRWRLPVRSVSRDESKEEGGPTVHYSS